MYLGQIKVKLMTSHKLYSISTRTWISLKLVVKLTKKADEKKTGFFNILIERERERERERDKERQRFKIV